MNTVIGGDSYDYLFKMVVIGGNFTADIDSGVGKSNLLSRFSSN